MLFEEGEAFVLFTSFRDEAELKGCCAGNFHEGADEELRFAAILIPANNIKYYALEKCSLPLVKDSSVCATHQQRKC